MKKTLLTLLFFSSICYAFAQKDTPPFIEVTGTADMEVVPDEIYIAITIREDDEGRTQRSVEEQENNLKNALLEIGISLDNLELSDANANYIHVKWKKKKAISRTDYRLKVSTAEEIAGVFEKLDELKIKSVRIVKVSHSKIKEFEKEIRVKAIKNAKEKADYLLAAIGERTGKAKEVSENNFVNSFREDISNIRGGIGDAVGFYVEGLSTYQHGKFKSTVQFQKIKLQASVFVKFGIE